MENQGSYPYATFLNVAFPQLSVVEAPVLIRDCTDRWYNQTLCKVNDSVIRLGVMQGEYHCHKHDNDDEFFFVLDGHFIIDLEGRSVDLRPREGFVVPKGVIHRTRAPERAVILMVATAAIIPTGANKCFINSPSYDDIWNFNKFVMIFVGRVESAKYQN